MAKAARLKVFQAQLGFYYTVVAAPSQAAALRAWGVHQDLFAQGEAKVITDPAVVKAAMAHPGALLRRAVGSNDTFELSPTGLPKIPAAEKPEAQARKSAPPKPSRPPADRSKLDAAEAQLRRLEARRLKEELALRAEADALEAKREAAQAAYVKAHAAAKSKAAAAEAAYRKAGGAS